ALCSPVSPDWPLPTCRPSSASCSNRRLPSAWARASAPIPASQTCCAESPSSRAKRPAWACTSAALGVSRWRFSTVMAGSSGEWTRASVPAETQRPRDPQSSFSASTRRISDSTMPCRAENRKPSSACTRTLPGSISMRPSMPGPPSARTSPSQRLLRPCRSCSLAAMPSTAWRTCSGVREWACSMSIWDKLDSMDIVGRARGTGLWRNGADSLPRMQEHALQLHFSDRQQADHPLAAGVLRLVRQANGTLGLGDAPGALLVQFCRDRRGRWLQLARGACGIHVNGRPVRRMALLRAGDAVYADGVELLVRAAAQPAANVDDAAGAAIHEACAVLRGVG